jgi:membrane-bound inhibitor of C-type lysozyme
MKTSTAIITLVVLFLVIAAGWWYYRGAPVPNNPGSGDANNQVVASAAFACNQGKSIGATFYQGSVALTLSDGRTMTLPQAISGSGIRYANADESFVFWGKGNTAFITEGASQDQTYMGCIVVSPDTSGTLTQIYATSTLGFSLRFPAGYVLDGAYAYTEMGPGTAIKGVKVTIPAQATTGTNLSKDTYVSVEELPNAATCSADLFVDGGKASSFSDSGVDYSVATTSGAGAGNLYDEAVFAIPGSSPCTAVRYFIHSTQVGNYPAGTVTQFDRTGLVNQFDLIRRSLVIGR